MLVILVSKHVKTTTSTDRERRGQEVNEIILIFLTQTGGVKVRNNFNTLG